MNYLLYNGNMVPVEEFNPGSHWLTPGFSLKEKMWFANGEIPFFMAHMESLEKILKVARRSWPDQIPPPDELLRLSRRLINKNKAFMGGWLGMEFLFTPRTVAYLATVEPFPSRTFPFDPEGKSATLSPYVKFSGNPNAGFPFYSRTLWEAEAFRTADGTPGESLFLNEKGVVTEATGANIFLILKNTILTPSAETGCITDVIRERILWSASQTGFRVMESDRITPDQLGGCEELFLASEGRGFTWIAALENHRFVKTKAVLIWKKFCKEAFPAVS